MNVSTRVVFRTIVVACAYALLPARMLVAQTTTVSGAVRDSLSGRPFAGATVQLISAATPWEAGRTATSDSAGRFVLSGVVPGRYVFGFQHPRLDSLGMDAVSRTIDVRAKANERMDLALPSAATLATSLCGRRRDSTGVLFGRVFDAVDGAISIRGSVIVRWGEFRFDTGGMHHTLAHVRAPIGRDGRYVVCGVPTDLPVLLSAAENDRTPAVDSLSRASSGEIEVSLMPSALLLHRDLFVGRATEVVVVTDSTPRVGSDSTRIATVLRGTARLGGRVTNEAGQPVANARVSIPGTGLESVTDTAGYFRLSGLPGGTRQAKVLALGFAPAQLTVDLRPDRTASLDATMRVRIPTLESVNVYAAKPVDLVGFYRRRAAGVGYFVDRDMIRKWGAPDVVNPIGDALATAPMLRQGGASGRGFCTPVIYVDGFRNEVGSLREILNPLDIGAIEVYANAADAPSQYNSPGTRLLDARNAVKSMPNSGSCAVIIIWTTAYVPSLNTSPATASPPAPGSRQ